jgi:hypothetical protein
MSIFKRGGCDENGPSGVCSKCGKRGKRGSCGVYWYKFMWNGEMIRESTRQKNDRVARNMESAHRTRLANGEVGIREKKSVPTVKAFCQERVEPWAKSTFEHASPKTWLWYGFGIDSLKKSVTLANLKLNEIGPELVAEYASERRRDGLQISSVNGCLRGLRRVLRLAVEWGVLETSPKVRFLSGEHRRERVITPKEEALYLAAALPLLHDVSVVLFDTGMRPEESHCLRWENITWDGGRNGVLLITKGKTKAARRVLAAKSARSHGARESLESGRGARRGLGVARRDERWTHQPRQPETATQESAEIGEGPPVRGLFNPAHVPHPAWRERL